MDQCLGEVVTVRYHVIGIYDAGDIIFLNSSSNYETDFTAVIFKEDEKYFTKKGIDPVSDYDNATIKTTGELQEFDGPEILLYHPYQVEVVDLFAVLADKIKHCTRERNLSQTRV